MSLPSVPFLKDQANRLVAYLGDKHRFRLKASSALEAVAAMYRHHDWNTLQALALRADGSSLAPSGSPSAPERYPVSWKPSQEPDLTVSAQNWFRHTLAEGGTKADRREWLQLHLSEHVDRGAAGVFVNSFGVEKTRVRGIYGEFKQHSEGHHAKDLTLNLLSDMEPEEIASMLVAISRFPGSTVEYWKQNAHQDITAAVRAVRTSAHLITLKCLVEQLRSPAAEPSIGLTEALVTLTDMEWTQHLFSERADAHGLSTWLAKGECLTMDWPEHANTTAGVATMYALMSATRARQASSREERVPGWAFGLGEFKGDQQMPGYMVSPVASMAAQARGANIALIMTTSDRHDVGMCRVGQEVLANVANTMLLKGCSPERWMDLYGQMGNKPMLVQSESITVSQR